MKVRVSFYKDTFHGMFRGISLDRVEFEYEGKADNVMAEAFDAAVAKGMNPVDTIKIEEVVE